MRNGVVGTLSDAVVVGHVTSVSPGRAFYESTGDVRVTQVPFDDSRATWRTVRAEVAVTELLGGQVAEGPIVIGFAVAPSTPFDVIADGPPALGDLVLFLEKDSQAFANDPAVQYSVGEDGAVLAEVEPDAGSRCRRSSPSGRSGGSR